MQSRTLQTSGEIVVMLLDSLFPANCYMYCYNREKLTFGQYPAIHPITVYKNGPIYNIIIIFDTGGAVV